MEQKNKLFIILVLISTLGQVSSAGAFQPFPQIAGIAGALFGSLTTLGGAISSSILAIFKDNSQLPLALAITLCGLCAAIIYYRIIKNQHKMQ